MALLDRVSSNLSLAYALSMSLSLGLVLLTVGCTAPSAEKEDFVISSESPSTAPSTSQIESPIAGSESSRVESPTITSQNVETKAESSAELSPLPIDIANSVPFPVANSNGDFGRTSYDLWKIVDRDPAGLNCRWSTDMPEEWYSPSAEWPDTNIQSWPVVRTLAYDTAIVSDGSPAGFMTIQDDQNAPWLKVSIGENSQICLIRANSQYVMPRR